MRCLITVLLLAVPLLSSAADLQPGQILEYKTRTGEAAFRQLPSAPEFQEGYDTWKEAFLAGRAGVFDMAVNATLDAMLGAKWEEKK